MKNAKCTSCGANIEVNESMDAGICPYCHAAYVTEKAINNYINNFTTNINNTFTKVVNGKVEDEGEEEFARGLTLLKLNKFWEARKQFAKAIKKSPNVGKYYFYFSYAVTQKFKIINNFAHDDYYMYSDSDQYYSPISDFFALATDSEKDELTQQYGYDLKNGVYGLIKDISLKNINSNTIDKDKLISNEKLFKIIADENINNLWDYADMFNQSIGKFKNEDPISTFWHMFKFMKKQLNEDDYLKFENNYFLLLYKSHDGILTIESDNYENSDMPIRIDNPNIHNLNINYSTKNQHLIITPNIKTLWGSIDILEIEGECNLTSVTNVQCKILVLSEQCTNPIPVKYVDVVYSKNPNLELNYNTWIFTRNSNAKTIKSYIIKNNKVYNRPIFNKPIKLEESLKLFAKLFPNVINIK